MNGLKKESAVQVGPQCRQWDQYPDRSAATTRILLEDQQKHARQQKRKNSRSHADVCRHTQHAEQHRKAGDKRMRTASPKHKPECQRDQQRKQEDESPVSKPRLDEVEEYGR